MAFDLHVHCCLLQASKQTNNVALGNCCFPVDAGSTLRCLSLTMHSAVHALHAAQNLTRSTIAVAQALLLHAGELMVGSKTVFFMDEISTGLDSSTTYAIVTFLRDQTHALSYTTMISLLQPAPESHDLFDDILLLAQGALFSLTVSLFAHYLRMLEMAAKVNAAFQHQTPGLLMCFT